MCVCVWFGSVHPIFQAEVDAKQAQIDKGVFLTLGWIEEKRREEREREFAHASNINRDVENSRVKIFLFSPSPSLKFNQLGSHNGVVHKLDVLFQKLNHSPPNQVTDQ